MPDDEQNGSPLRAVAGLGLVVVHHPGRAVRDASIAERLGDPGLRCLGPDKLRADFVRAMS